MYRVVNATNGTGKQAATSYSVICGKTGTAQWGPPSKKQNLFFNPLKGVAFNRHYVSKKALIIPDLDDEEPEVVDTPKAPGKAILVDEIEVPKADIPDEASLSAPKALIVEEAPVTPALSQPEVPVQSDPIDPATSPTETEPNEPNKDNAPPLRDFYKGSRTVLLFS